MKKFILIATALMSSFASAEIIPGVYEGRIPGGIFGWANKGDCKMTVEEKSVSKDISKLVLSLEIDELKYTFQDFDYNIERTL